MPYCLLQLDPVAPSADQLKRAFKALRILTEADAVKTAVEARGILVKNLSLDGARGLQRVCLSASRTESKVTTFDPIRGLRTKVVTDVRHKVVDNSQFILELVLTGGATRFQIEAALFMFKYCFDRPELNLAQKLGLLIEMLAQQAPQAVLNHGAAALSCGGPGDWAYASKAALFDELTWHLWRMANNG